jgi:hypothetical protein
MVNQRNHRLDHSFVIVAASGSAQESDEISLRQST